MKRPWVWQSQVSETDRGAIRSRPTFELLLQRATRSDAQGAGKLPKVDLTAVVLIEDPENIVGIVVWVPEREDFLVYLDERGLIEFARGTILEEDLVAAI